MIRFIATDLDGTLLNDRKELPKEIFGLVRQLHSKGILFSPASGRQYANLRKLFAPVADLVAFVCENGALVKYCGKTLFSAPILSEHLEEALGAVRSLPGLYPMLCGEEWAYIEDDAQPFYGYATAAYTNCRKVPSLNGVIGGEPVLKIAVYGGEENWKPLPPLLPHLRIIPSGFGWCDVSAPEVNKGVAVRVIQKTFGFGREECVAFGDHMNDYEMLDACGTAYVPENAYPPLKARFRRTVPNNEEGGVIVKLREIVGG